MHTFKPTLKAALLASTALLCPAMSGACTGGTNHAANVVPVDSRYSAANLMLRFVNAGLRMRVPSVNGLPMTLVAEDGKQQPDATPWLKEYTPTTFPMTEPKTHPKTQPKTQSGAPCSDLAGDHPRCADQRQPVQVQPRQLCPDGQHCPSGDLPSDHDQ